ncbi:DNA polymerase Y family protein [soil metagenome]
MMRRSPIPSGYVSSTRTARIERAIIVWCPDWPIIAAVRAAGIHQELPVALIEKGVVFASSASARLEGVRRGQRVREAQSRCTELVVLPYDAALDIRSFEPVLDRIEETMPGVQLLRPGTCAVRSRGPARYYGGEEEAALWLLDALDELGIPGGRIGVADGPFTAELAARSQPGSRVGRIRLVPEGGSAEFLSPLPVGLLADPALVTLLRRLGIRILGEFAALEMTDVAARFGEDGARLHSLAGGLDSRPVIARTPPEELDERIDFEPPLDRIDQVAFGVKATASRFIDELVRAKLVCTSIRVEIETENVDELSQRSWLHPRSFTAADVVDRVRWQLQGDGNAGGGLRSGVTRVRIVPEAVDAIGNHEQGLWGTSHDERIHHGLSRVQSLLGHGAVVTAVIGGGRTLYDRQKLVAWGDPTAVSVGDSPWPGQLPDPTPGTIFESRQPVTVLTDRGEPVTVDDRGMLSGVPAKLSTNGRSFEQITAWAGPWPLLERWWEPDVLSSGTINRFQVVDGAGVAWLLVLEGHSLDAHRWWAEARYD